MQSTLKAPAIFVVTLLVYIPAMQAGFIWDDDAFLTRNPLIHASDGLYRFWFTTEAPDYFPLTSSMLWLEWRLWGPNPIGFHVVNVLLHATSSVLIWLILRELRAPGAWVAGALFAIHPVNVESVAWVTERKNTLPMVLFCLSTLLYVHHLRNGRWPAYAGALLAFLLALLSKTSVVMLPLILLGLTAWHRGTVRRKDVLSLLPFLALSLVLGLVTVWFQYHRAIGPEVVRADGFLSRLAVAGCAIWFYLYKALLPVGLCFVYPRWELNASSPISYLPAAAIIVLGLLLWRSRGTWGKPFLLGLGYYVVTLLPVLGFLNIYFMRYSYVADHWQYLPLAGVVALVAAGAGVAVLRLHGPKRHYARAAGVAVLSILGVMTFYQSRIYRDQYTLWQHTLERNPAAWMAHNNLGNLLREDGRTEDSLRHLRLALDLAPDDPDLHHNLAAAYLQAKDLENAERHARAALKLDPQHVKALNNLAMLLAEKGANSAASQMFEKALSIHPGASYVLNNYGLHLMKRGDYAGAQKRFEAAVSASPDYALGYANYGRLLRKMGRLDEAVESLRHAVSLSPRSASFHNALGEMQAEQGEHLRATAHFSKALEIRPGHPKAGRNLLESRAALIAAALLRRPGDADLRRQMATTLMSLKRYREAVKHFEELLRSRPESVLALDGLAWLQATDPSPETRDARKAIELAEKACRLTKRQDAYLLDTLAIAYSSAGRFKDAQRVNKEAMAVLALLGDTTYLAELRQRLGLYEAGQPFLRD